MGWYAGGVSGYEVWDGVLVGGGGVTSHSRSPDGGECGIRGGGTHRDVHRDPTKPAVHKNTKYADRDAVTEMLHPPASIVVRTRSLDLVCRLRGVLGHCLLEHPPIDWWWSG